MIGNEFSLSLLSAVYPIQNERKFLAQELSVLVNFDFIILKHKSAWDSLYMFKSSNILEVSKHLSLSLSLSLSRCTRQCCLTCRYLG